LSVNSNFAYIMLNVTPINLEIGYRKILMLWQLCRLPSDQLAKKVFVNRLIRFVNLDRQFRGFIPDIYRILQKYGLLDYLNRFLTTGCFVSKTEWKRVLRQCINVSWRVATLHELNSILDDKGYTSISIEDSISLWQKKDSDPQLVRAFATIPNTVGHVLSRHYPRTCKICDMNVENITEHRLSFCVSCEKQRKRLVYAIYDQCGVEQFNKLKGLSLKDQCARIIDLATQCVNRQPRFSSVTFLLGRVLRS